MPLADFPGGEGYGTTTTHARDPDAVTLFVDNLDDDGPAAVPFTGGCYRRALLYDGPAYIVFRVSGVIPMNSRPVKYSKHHKYIAGQTSPGGVAFSGEEHQMNTHDILVRHCRFYTGDEDTPTNAQGVNIGYDNRDCFNTGAPPTDPDFENVHDVHFDHCSFRGSVDENHTIGWKSHDITTSWCISAEGLYRSKHPKTLGPPHNPHSMGMLCNVAAHNLSWHHNLLANCNQRMPQMSGNTDELGVTSPSMVDFRCNSVFNWGDEACALEKLGNAVNIVNNFYKLGPDFSSTTKHMVRLRNDAADAQIFIEGNLDPLNTDPDADNWQLIRLDNGQVPPEFGHRLFTPLATPTVTTESAFVAHQLVLLGAGATKPFRDSLDLRTISQARRRPCSFKPGESFFVNSFQEMGGRPIFQQLPVPEDTNQDGIPDQWCVDNGFSPSATIMNDDFGDGYSVMEHYLSELAGDVFP